MRCIVIGSKELSCVILDNLVKNGHEVPFVISRDDEPGMRIWHEMGRRSLKSLAEAYGIDVLEGVSVNDQETLDQIRDAQPELILSCFWSELFKEEILAIPPRGVFNFHTAFLPRNRGSRPIPWSMIKGDPVAGVTLHQMLLGVDDGPIVAQKSVLITNADTGKSMYDKVMNQAYELAEEVIELFASNSEVLTDQNESEATFQLRGEPHGGQYNYFWEEDKIDRFIRSFIFAPFQAHRMPPQVAQSAGRIGLIVSSELETDNSQFNKPYAHTAVESGLNAFQIKSGGSAELRRRLRSLLPKGATISYFPAERNGLERYYPVLESLKRGNYMASISRFESIESNPQFSQPYRYENGILEIPINSVNPSTSEFETLIRLAENFSEQNDCTCYLHILLDDRFGAQDHEIFTRELSQQIQNHPISLLTYGDVCEEFDTDYEDISA